MKKNKQKKLIIIIVAVVVAILAVVGIVIAINSNQPEEVVETPVPTKKKKVTAPLNIIPVADRPMFKLEPFIKNGKNLIIELLTLPKEATDGEYEIEYTIGSATAKNASGRDTKVPENEATEGLQGFVGELDIAKLPSTTEKMLGSCSAGGACIYHAGVTEGKITLRFAGPENYAVQSVFTYFENGTASNETVDGRFTIAAPELVKATDFLIVEEMGIPTGLPGEIVTFADENEANATKPSAYGVYFSDTISAKTVEITFTDTGSATGVAYYDGSTWEVVSSPEFATNTVTVEVPLAEVYALFK